MPVDLDEDRLRIGRDQGHSIPPPDPLPRRWEPAVLGRRLSRKGWASRAKATCSQRLAVILEHSLHFCSSDVPFP